MILSYSKSNPRRHLIFLPSPNQPTISLKHRIASASHHVLFLGGHGKVAQYLTPLLLQRSWAVTSIIRDSAQVPAVKQLGEKDLGSKKGNPEVLVHSIKDVKNESHAKAVIDEVKPDYII